MNTPTCIAAVCTLCALLPAQLQKTPFITGLDEPVFVTAPRGDDRLFIALKDGRIVIWKNGNLLQLPFLNIGAEVANFGESGLLGLAFHPDYDDNGHFFVSYVQNEPFASVVKRFTVSNNPDLASPGSGQLVLGPISQPQSNHNGGCIQFGPDGHLYVSIGDGGIQGDPNCEAQNRQSLLGKMLRINVDNPLPSIPPDNPFISDPNTSDEIWALGFRNPWRFSFDRLTGDLYVTDVGFGTREEISFQPFDSPGGENYGWNTMEGATCFANPACVPGQLCHGPQLTPPIHDYNNGNNCAIIGGYVYRGSNIPGLKGTYFYGDFCSGRIWSFRYQGGQLTNLVNRTTELGAVSVLSSFGEDGHGELYIVSLSGTIYRLEGNEGSAVFSTFGTGCQGTTGIPTLEPEPGSLPLVGQTLALRLDSLPTAPANTPFALLGMSNSDWAGFSLPRPLNFAGLFGCTQYISIDIASPLLNTSGTAAWNIPIPLNPALIGVTFYTQGLVLDFGVNAANAIVTNAGEGVVGM